MSSFPLCLIVTCTGFIVCQNIIKTEYAHRSILFALEVLPSTSPRYVLTLNDENVCEGAEIILCPYVKFKPTQIFSVHPTDNITSRIENIISWYALTNDMGSEYGRVIIRPPVYEGQWWTEDSNSRFKSIVKDNRTACLDIEGGVPKMGARIVYKPCDNSKSQRFAPAILFNAKYEIISE